MVMPLPHQRFASLFYAFSRSKPRKNIFCPGQKQHQKTGNHKSDTPIKKERRQNQASASLENIQPT